MWQVLVAAAVAGSTGLVAKRLFSPNTDSTISSDLLQSRNCEDDSEDREGSGNILKSEVPIATVFDSPVVQKGFNESDCEGSEGIFRFSSSGSRSGSKSLAKKNRSRCRELKKGVADEKGQEGADCVEVGFEQRKSRRRFAVCLKRRKTSKCLAAGTSGSLSSKDGSLFSWGLGVGMMYMMSAGKAEIKKLNMTMEETTKVVQELKTKLDKRKSKSTLQAQKVQTNPANINCKLIQAEHGKLRAEMGDLNEIKIPGLPFYDDGECGSSVLTEEPDTELREMDKLKLEFESELEKLPWCTIEASQRDGELPKPGEVQTSQAYRSHGGVLPAELNEKLYHVLIEQQETQIVELESELHLAQSKLQQKEVELQALKDCVNRLTEFSLSADSDDKSEADIEEECTSDWQRYENIVYDPKKSAVGMKRPINFDSCAL